jgi:putative flippase GtrA
MASSDEHTMTSALTGHGWFSTLRQFLRFGLVGGLNTNVDLLILNVLLWLFPTQHTSLLIIYNSIAYGIGAINSFVLNKYWTFGHRKHTTPAELLRFVVTTCAGIVSNDLLIWMVGSVLHPFISNATIWTNASKILAILGTSSISYLGMRLWVFARRGERTA